MANDKLPQGQTPRQLSIFTPQFNERIRHINHDGVEYFSLVDMMAEFSDSKNEARKYWSDTKKRLIAEGFQLSERITQLKLAAPDGKMRKTDCADGPTCLRIIQSIPSENAEPIREWLAGLGYERLEEAVNPGLATARAYKRDLVLLERAGYAGHEAAEHLRSRIASVDTFKALAAVIASKCDNPQFAEIVNTEYLGLFNQTAAALRQILDTKSIRDKLPDVQLNALIYAESQLKLMLKQADKLTNEQICNIAYKICYPLGKQLQEVCELLGVDLVTGKPLLKGRVQ